MTYDQLMGELKGISIDTMLSQKQKFQFIESTVTQFFELTTVGEIAEIKAAISAARAGIVKQGAL